MAYKQGAVRREDYIFDYQAKTITFSSSYQGLQLSEIFFISNYATATDIFDPGNASKGATLSGLVLTLLYSGAVGISNNDNLRIIVGSTTMPTLVTATPTKDPAILDQTDHLESIHNDLDQLLLAQDNNENMPLYVREMSITKKDENQALVPSDGIVYRGSSSLNNGVINLIDTTGYQSIVVQVTVASVTFGISNDGTTYTTPLVYSYPTSVLISGASLAVGQYSIGCTARYFRIISVNANGVVASAVTILRQTPFNATPIENNTTRINGIAVVTAGVTGLQAIGGNIAPGTARTSNPVPIGGTDSGNLTRTLRTDTTGRPTISGDIPGTVLPVPVVNVTSDGGSYQIELLRAMLIEQQITNYYLYELLNQSIGNTSEPNEFRNDPNIIP